MTSMTAPTGIPIAVPMIAIPIPPIMAPSPIPVVAITTPPIVASVILFFICSPPRRDNIISISWALECPAYSSKQ